MPIHDFLMLPEVNDDYSGYLNHFNHPGSLQLDDDIVLYMLDTLKWVPTVNPANPSEWCGFGLNYHGPTVINQTGASKAAKLFRLWSSLLQEGPENLELSGLFDFTDNDPTRLSGRPMFTASRELVVKTLIEIANIAEKASSGRYYLLHLGI